MFRRRSCRAATTRRMRQARRVDPPPSCAALTGCSIVPRRSAALLRRADRLLDRCLRARQCYALCDEKGCSVMGEVGFMRTLKIGIYFALWFALSTGYNLQNKVRLNLLPLPWTQSAFSLFVGTAFVMPLWLTGIRKAPILSKDAIMTLLPIAFCHSIGHIGAVVSAGAGPVSFTQIVKAAEPVFTCVLSAVILGSRVAPLTMLSLLPIVLGVSLASMTELSFTWLSFGGAMLSNLAFAIRNMEPSELSPQPAEWPSGPQDIPGELHEDQTGALL